jgi:hypothetical protein
MMGKKVQRAFTLMTVFFALSTATVTASSLWGDYEGYSKARVIINNEVKEFTSSEVPGFIVNGATVLPLRTLADSLQALVKWDDSNKTVSVFKPNVHLIVAYDVDRKKFDVTTPFGTVRHGKTISFDVFPQVENLKTPITSMKISILSPSGQEVATRTASNGTIQQQSFWFVERFEKLTFSEQGIYSVKLYMQLESGGDYQVVSEKQILSQVE